jgi:ABC-type uncharacterized transport system substrate-binding protein
VFYVNSYHEGYAPSDEAMTAIRERLGRAGVQLETYFLDAKRHSETDQLLRRAAEAVERIEKFRPDVLIASDDDAVKYVIAPHFRNGPIPAVFCGVNWSSEAYGLPSENVTGILETVPIEDAIKDLQAAFGSLRRIRTLSEDTTSERSNRKLLEPLYRKLGMEPDFALVSDFAAWKKEFVKAQREADVIYLPTMGGVAGWDEAEARKWVEQHIRKPVFTCDDFMMPYAAYGLTKVAREQGEWAAEAALKILAGARPAEIPLAVNRQARCYWNPALSARIGFRPPEGRACEARP